MFVRRPQASGRAPRGPPARAAPGVFPPWLIPGGARLVHRHGAGCCWPAAHPLSASVCSQRLKDEIAEVTSEIESLGLTEERWAASLTPTAAGAPPPDDVTSFFCVLQEEHAEEQTDGHWPKEVQHGPQEGERA